MADDPSTQEVSRGMLDLRVCALGLSPFTPRLTYTLASLCLITARLRDEILTTQALFGALRPGGHVGGGPVLEASCRADQSTSFNTPSHSSACLLSRTQQPVCPCRHPVTIQHVEAQEVLVVGTPLPHSVQDDLEGALILHGHHHVPLPVDGHHHSAGPCGHEDWCGCTAPSPFSHPCLWDPVLMTHPTLTPRWLGVTCSMPLPTSCHCIWGPYHALGPMPSPPCNLHHSRITLILGGGGSERLNDLPNTAVSSRARPWPPACVTPEPVFFDSCLPPMPSTPHSATSSYSSATSTGLCCSAEFVE